MMTRLMKTLALAFALILSASMLPGSTASAGAAAPVLVLAVEGSSSLPVGSTASVTLTATTPDGAPVPGLVVEFTRTGPGEGAGGGAGGIVTDAEGIARYSFQGANPGTAEVTATVTDGAGNPVGSAGPVSVTFGSCPPLPDRSAGRCSLIHAKLTGENLDGHDVLTVNLKKAAGDRVRLYRRDGDGRVLLRDAKLGDHGIRSFVIADHNRHQRTRYVAKVGMDQLSNTVELH